MNLEQLIKKMRIASFLTMVSFLLLTVSVLIFIVSLFILSVSLKIALIFFGIFFFTVLLFLIAYLPSDRLNSQYSSLFEKGTPRFLYDKLDIVELEEPFVTTRPSMNGTVYINKDHKPIHSQFIKVVLDDKVVLYPKGAFQKDDTCKIISATAHLSLVLYKSEKILVETKAIDIR